MRLIRTCEGRVREYASGQPALAFEGARHDVERHRFGRLLDVCHESALSFGGLVVSAVLLVLARATDIALGGQSAMRCQRSGRGGDVPEAFAVRRHGRCCRVQQVA